MKQIIKNKKTLFLGGIILLILISVVGLSYAYFSTSDKQSTANTFRSGCLNITIENESDVITLNNAYPISDLEGLNNKGYTFTIKNTCNKDTNYMINLESLNESPNSLKADYLKVALSSDTMDNLISKLGDNPTTEALITGAYESHNLYNGTIKANEAKEFTLREWIDYDVTKEQGMNKTVTNKINVIARPDLNVEELPEIKTNYSNYEINASLKGIDVETIEEDNNIVVVENKSENPFVYNDETKEFSIKKQGTGYKSSQIIISPEKAGDGEFCYKLTENGGESSSFDIYIEDEKIGEESLTLSEKSGCIALTNVQPTEKIKISFGTEYCSESELTFSVKFNKVKTTNKIPFKYCISDKNICEPNIDGNIMNYKLNLNLDLGRKIVCTKINNNKTSCSDVMKIEPIKLEPLMAKNFLKGSTNLDERDIESITILDKVDIPENAIESWDASARKNGTVMAYYTDTDSNGKYELFLAGDGKVVAPTDSSFLFPVIPGNVDPYGFAYVKRIDLSKLDTSKVTNMSGMFSRIYGLTNLDISNFDTSNVTDMSDMFYGTSLTSLNIGHFDTSNVTDMSYMFANSSDLTNLNVSNFDTSNVTNMSHMFANMSSLTSLNVSNFDTSKTTDMSYMFRGMNKLISLDLSNFNTSNVTDMSYMFEQVLNITSLDVSSFDTSNVTNMRNMFKDLWVIEILNLSNFYTPKVTNMEEMFSGMKEVTSLNISNFNTSNVTNMGMMFYMCSSLANLNINHFDTSNVTDMNYMFGTMKNLISLDLSKADFSKVTRYGYMFNNTSNLNTIKVKDTTAKTFIEARLADVNKTGVTVTPVS